MKIAAWKSSHGSRHMEVAAWKSPHESRRMAVAAWKSPQEGKEDNATDRIFEIAKKARELQKIKQFRFDYLVSLQTLMDIPLIEQAQSEVKYILQRDKWNTFEEITKDTPEKSLLSPLKKSGGRNNQGRITCRHRGGGHKRKYRIIDFKRRKFDVEATVVGIEYDPNRTCRIALLK